MPKSCVAYGCHNHAWMKEKISFYRIPSKNGQKRKLWIQALGRMNADGTIWTPTSKWSYVCSRHFVYGKPHPERDHPDFVPSIFVYSSKTLNGRCCENGQDGSSRPIKRSLKRWLQLENTTPPPSTKMLRCETLTMNYSQRKESQEQKITVKAERETHTDEDDDGLHHVCIKQIKEEPQCEEISGFHTDSKDLLVHLCPPHDGKEEPEPELELEPDLEPEPSGAPVKLETKKEPKEEVKQELEEEQSSSSAQQNDEEEDEEEDEEGVTGMSGYSSGEDSPPGVPQHVHDDFRRNDDHRFDPMVPNNGVYDPAIQKMTSMLAEVLEVVKNLSRDVQFIKNQLAEGNMTPGGPWEPAPTLPFQLPITTEQDFDEAESLLTEESVQQNMIARLALVRGTDSDQLIRRMLAHVMTNALACRFNWSGRKDKRCSEGKKPFKNTTLQDCMFAATRQFDPKLTNKDYSETVKKWLRYAPERDGRRNRSRPDHK